MVRLDKTPELYGKAMLSAKLSVKSSLISFNYGRLAEKSHLGATPDSQIMLKV